jgi:subtilisin family serine protease
MNGAPSSKLSSVGLAALSAILVVLILVPGAAAAGPAAQDTATILVKFTATSQAAAAIAAQGDRHVGDTQTHVAVVQIDARRTVGEKVAEYNARRDVVYAEPNYIAHALLAAPNDPSYASQWAFGKIQALSGWSIYPGSYTPSGGATLAVVDTGVQANHPDLGSRVRTTSGATCLTGTCVAGPATDDNGHGTHVAGIAGATTNNAVGVAGTAFSSPIVPVKVLNAAGSGSYASVASGIIWAAQHGARVMNLSLGGTGFSQTLCDAVATATNTYNTLVVVSAGNSASSTPSYPAACAGALGVAATDSNDAPATFSNFGSPNVFISSPGVGIFSTYLGSTYRTLSGTSMAAPFVTGLAALLVGQNSASTPRSLKQRLAQTSDKVGTGTYGADPYGTCTGCTWNARYGYGRINVFRALSAGTTAPDFSLSATPASRTVTAGGSTTYTVSIARTNGFAGSVSLGVTGLPTGATASFSPNPASSASTLTVSSSTTTAPGTSTLTITGTSGGLVHTTSVAFVVQSSSSADFSLTVSPTTQAVDVGNSTAYSVTISRTGGFLGNVSLGTAGLPSGATASFNPNPAANSSTLTVNTSVMTPVGSFTFTITGVSGGLSHSVSATLVVRSNYALSASPSSRTVTAGAATTYTVAVTRYGGFAGLVNLSVSGLPAGATATFAPNPADASAVLSVGTSAATPTGTYVLTIKGVAGSRMLTHTTTVTLVIN